MDKHPIQGGGGGGSTPSLFMLQKPGQASAWWVTIGSYADFTFT